MAENGSSQFGGRPIVLSILTCHYNAQPILSFPLESFMSKADAFRYRVVESSNFQNRRGLRQLEEDKHFCPLGTLRHQLLEQLAQRNRSPTRHLRAFFGRIGKLVWIAFIANDPQVVARLSCSNRGGGHIIRNDLVFARSSPPYRQVDVLIVVDLGGDDVRSMKTDIRFVDPRQKTVVVFG